MDLRRSKGMVLEEGAPQSVGSFFVNPIVDPSTLLNDFLGPETIGRSTNALYDAFSIRNEKAGFQEITKIYYTSGFHEPGAGLACGINKDRFNKLSKSHQKMIEVACGEANLWNLHQYLANNSQALTRLKAGGVKTLEFPDDVWDAFGKASQEVMDDNMGNELFKKVFESVTSSMKQSAAWDDLSSGAYTRQRTRVLG